MRLPLLGGSRPAAAAPEPALLDITARGNKGGGGGGRSKNPSAVPPPRRSASRSRTRRDKGGRNKERGGRSRSRSRNSRDALDSTAARKATPLAQAGADDLRDPAPEPAAADENAPLAGAPTTRGRSHSKSRGRSRSRSKSKGRAKASRSKSKNGRSQSRGRSKSRNKYDVPATATASVGKESHKKNQAKATKKASKKQAAAKKKRAKSKAKKDQKEKKATAKAAKAGSKSPRSAAEEDRLHTVQSYNTADSVEELLEERSRYSRYTVRDDNAREDARAAAAAAEAKATAEAAALAAAWEAAADDKYSRSVARMGPPRLGLSPQSQVTMPSLDRLWSASTDEGAQWRGSVDEEATEELREPAALASPGRGLRWRLGSPERHPGIEQVLTTEADDHDPVYLSIRPSRSDGGLSPRHHDHQNKYNLAQKKKELDAEKAKRKLMRQSPSVLQQADEEDSTNSLTASVDKIRQSRSQASKEPVASDGKKGQARYALPNLFRRDRSIKNAPDGAPPRKDQTRLRHTSTLDAADSPTTDRYTSRLASPRPPPPRPLLAIPKNQAEEVEMVSLVKSPVHQESPKAISPSLKEPSPSGDDARSRASSKKSRSSSKKSSRSRSKSVEAAAKKEGRSTLREAARRLLAPRPGRTATLVPQDDDSSIEIINQVSFGSRLFRRHRSATPSKRRRSRSRSRSRSRKGKAADAAALPTPAELDEYSAAGRGAADDAEEAALVQCLRFYACGAMADATDTVLKLTGCAAPPAVAAAAAADTGVDDVSIDETGSWVDPRREPYVPEAPDLGKAAAASVVCDVTSVRLRLEDEAAPPSTRRRVRRSRTAGSSSRNDISVTSIALQPSDMSSFDDSNAASSGRGLARGLGRMFRRRRQPQPARDHYSC